MAQATRKLQIPVKVFSLGSERKEREKESKMARCQEKERAGRHETPVTSQKEQRV